MVLKIILCVQHFCSFGAMLFILNLLIITDSIVICVPCMLNMFAIFFETWQNWKISYVRWLNFV